MAPTPHPLRQSNLLKTWLAFANSIIGTTQVGLVATQAFMNYADGVLTCSAADSNPNNVRASIARKSEFGSAIVYGIWDHRIQK